MFYSFTHFILLRRNSNLKKFTKNTFEKRQSTRSEIVCLSILSHTNEVMLWQYRLKRYLFFFLLSEH